jgi:Domain of unknown function (DUF4926)
MVLNEYDIVALTQDVQATYQSTHQPLLLPSGQVGTILMGFKDQAYLVDFADADGRTYAMATIPGHWLIQLMAQPTEA